MTNSMIRKFPDTILRKKARGVYKVGAAEKALLTSMAETMYMNQGVGLAALQVGIDKQLAVIDIGNGLIKMVNPIIIRKEGREICEEGCLSVPGIVVKVKRAKDITVNFLNENGEAVQLKASGLLARAAQHEVDHLMGILIIDYLNPVKKMLLKKGRGLKNSRPKKT